MIDTMDELPEVLPEPDALERLVKANEALKRAAKEQNEAAEAAYRREYDKHAGFIARCQAVTYELLAECYALGFTTQQINLQLHGHP